MVSDLILGINITVLSTMLRVISEAVSRIVRSLSQLRDCHCVNNYTKAVNLRLPGRQAGDARACYFCTRICCAMKMFNRADKELRNMYL